MPCSLRLEKVSATVSLPAAAPRLAMGAGVSTLTEGHRPAPPPWGQGVAVEEEASAAAGGKPRGEDTETEGEHTQP